MFLKLLNQLFGIFPKNDLQTLLKKGSYLVDVRTAQEFAQGSVKGAVNIPLDILQTQLSKFKNKENIIVFCRSGNRSGQAKQLLNQNNFQNVTNGGTWQNVNNQISLC